MAHTKDNVIGLALALGFAQLRELYNTIGATKVGGVRV